MSCIGCGVKTNDKEYETACNNAQTHADKDKQDMAVFKDDEGRWTYENAFTAAARGVNFKTVVQYARGTTPA